MTKVASVIFGGLLAVGLFMRVTSPRDEPVRPVHLLWMVAFFVSLALYLVLFRRDDRRRVARLREYCRSRGWFFTESDPSLIGRWRVSPFEVGRKPTAKGVVRGMFGPHRMTAFTFGHFIRRRFEHQEQMEFMSVVSLSLPSYLPWLCVTPRDAKATLGEALGTGDAIRLESDDFNQRFVVHAHDRKFASDVLNPRTMAGLLSAPPHTWQICGNDIIWWAPDTTLELAKIVEVATLLAAVVDGVPSFVWHDHGVTPHQPDLLGGTSS